MCRPHIPRSQFRGTNRTTKEVGHRGGVIGPAYGVTVGLGPRAMAEWSCGMTVVTVVQLGQLEWAVAISTLLGAWDRMVFLYHPASEGASGQGV